MFKETRIEEPANCETLYMELAYRNENYEEKRMISIGVLPHDSGGEEGTISLQVVNFLKGWECKLTTADLTREEIDLVVKGLLEAKARMSNE